MIKSDCCGADWRPSLELGGWECPSCGKHVVVRPRGEVKVKKLTPAQVKAIRWPNEETLKAIYRTEHQGEPQGSYKRMMYEAIRYALKDLVEEGE